MKINPNVAEFVWISVFLATIFSTKGQDGCKVLLFLGCVKDQALSGHVMKTFSFSLSDEGTCQRKCFMEANCVSYNLGPIEGEMRSCELNDDDHVTYPGEAASKEGFEYCTFQNPCLSNPCPAGKVCEPDATWNSFLCKDGRWSSWGSWSSCFCDSQTRTRVCRNPFTQQNGTDCVGPHEEKQSCIMATESKTIDGESCILPFTYKNVQYDRCTCAGHDRPWCYTSTIWNWGNCVYSNLPKLSTETD